MTKAGFTPIDSHRERVSFFRQSGWLMFANMAAGVLMWAVHFLSKRMPEAEYGLLVTLFSMTMIVPVLPLQMVFAQQTARSLASGQEARLARMIRRSGLALCLVWVLGAGVVVLFHKELLAAWQIAHPAALWMTVLALLGALLLPALWGILQGRQDFFSMGMSMILAGAGRFGCAAIIVLVLGGGASGVMVAVVLGYGLAVGYTIWRSRDLWSGHGEPFQTQELLRQVLPLMFGFGACQFLFTADTMFVKAWFPESAHAYGAAGTLSRALMWFVLPLAGVMFPKIVHSTARSEKTDLLAVTLVGTGVLAVCGGLGLWLVGPLVVPFVFKQSYVDIATPLLPWYAGAMVPLSLANVLINNLLAKGDYRPVPWLVALTVAYALVLIRVHGSLVQVLQVLTSFNSLFFILALLFTWVWKPTPKRKGAELPAPTG